MNQKELGAEGEKRALRYLLDKGYELIETNWRWGHKEIDIIVKDGQELVFVEVKTRTNLAFGQPELAVNAKKEKNLTQAALGYLEKTSHKGEIRFDVISIIHHYGNWTIKHINNAFFPGL